MLTRKRIRDILQNHGLTKHQMDAIAAYCDSVQTELTEEDVQAMALFFKYHLR